jgi:transaldolase
VKNPEYPDTKYITGLVAPNTVNTIPDKTLQTFAEHGALTGDTITGTAAQAQAVFDNLTAAGIDLAQVFADLENHGVEKFEASWRQLLDTYPAGGSDRREPPSIRVPAR